MQLIIIITIIIIVIILLDLHSFDTPHIPTVTFLTVIAVDSVHTYTVDEKITS